MVLILWAKLRDRVSRKYRNPLCTLTYSQNQGANWIQSTFLGRYQVKYGKYGNYNGKYGTGWQPVCSKKAQFIKLGKIILGCYKNIIWDFENFHFGPFLWGQMIFSQTFFFSILTTQKWAKNEYFQNPQITFL